MSTRRIPVAIAGFSFLEVIACLLVLGIGVAAAVGMVMYGVFLASRAQGMATGMATAMTVAADPTPLSPPPGWTGAAGSGEAKGYLNGFYVERSESVDAGTGARLPAGFTSSVVTVDVYDNLRGRAVASYTTRVLRQAVP